MTVSVGFASPVAPSRKFATTLLDPNKIDTAENLQAKIPAAMPDAFELNGGTVHNAMLPIPAQCFPHNWDLMKILNALLLLINSSIDLHVMALMHDCHSSKHAD